MTFIRTRATLIILLLVCATGAAPSAQSPGAQNPSALPPVEAPDQPAVEQEPVYRPPIFRLMQDYRLPPGNVVRDVQTVFGNATIEGHVQGDVVVVMGSARVAGTGIIDGSLVVVGGSAEIESDHAVGRDLVIIGGTLTAPPTFSPRGEHVVIGAPWLGDLLRDVLPWMTRGLLWGRLIVPDLAWVWAIVGVFFLVYLALNAVFDRPVATTADVIVERPLSAFVGGLLVLLLSVPVLAIVAASVIGLAIVPFLLCGLVVAGLIGKTAVCRAIGRSVMRGETPESRGPALVAFAIGFVLLTLAYMVPVLGFVTWALTSVLALGAATVTFRSYLRRERKAAAPAAREMALAPTAPQGPAVSADAETSLPPVAPPPPPVEPPPPAPPVFNQGLAQYPRATFLDRLAAFVLDVILVAIASALLDPRRDGDGFFFFLLLAYHVAFWAWKGTTLGGIICNLRVTRTDGTDLRFVDSVVRGLSAIFSIAALGIGCLWMLQDPERQMWHDKIAGTLVVKVPRNLVLP